MLEKTPTVSIILPTYNRARFLPQALESIRAQEWTNWELIIVDDGSTDETAEIIGDLTARGEQPIQFIQQENQGPAEARNTGLDHVTGKYVAFFDSDDKWLPHHLQDCVAALESAPDVEWIYAASQIVREHDQEILAENCFYVDGASREFMSLHSRAAADMKIIDDPQATQVAIEYGIYCGLQCSVFGASFFEDRRIPSFRVGEDRVLSIQALASNVKIGYLDKVHVIYHVHADNSCATDSKNNSVARTASVYYSLEDAYRSLLNLPSLSQNEKKAIRKRLQREIFWHLGYGVYRHCGDVKQARQMYRRGLGYWPWDWRCWKTYIASMIKH